MTFKLQSGASNQETQVVEDHLTLIQHSLKTALLKEKIINVELDLQQSLSSEEVKLIS